MSIRKISENAIDRFKTNKNINSLIQPPSLTNYSRPAGWLQLPTVNDGDEKFVGLHKVVEGNNYVALRASNNYTVDWGDGVTENYSANSIAQHVYEYSVFDPLANTYITTDGIPYKQTLIVVTPQAANSLVNLSLQHRHTSLSQTTSHVPCTGWLDISIGGSSLATINVGATGATSTIFQHNLRQAQIYSNALTSANSLFENCKALRIIPKLNLGNCLYLDSTFATCLSLEQVSDTNTSVVLAMSNTFSSCASLRTVPNLNYANVTSFTNTFRDCNNLTEVKDLTFLSTIYANGMFATCDSIEKVQNINFPNLITPFGFSNCNSLKEVNNIYVPKTYFFANSCSALTSVNNIDGSDPNYPRDMFGAFLSNIKLKRIKNLKLANVTSLQQTFNNCYVLEEISTFDTSNCTNFLLTFGSCYALKETPSFNYGSASSLGSTFSNCWNLERIPSLNTFKGVTLSSTFGSCYSLLVAPDINTSNVTSFSSVFSACSGLIEVPLYNTASATNMTSMFQNCYNLKTVPEFNTSNVTNMTTMFSGCESLKKVPNFNYNSVTNMSSMFLNCGSLSEVPTLNTISLTDARIMFGNCVSLKEVTMNTSALVFANSMFYGCNSLIKTGTLDLSKCNSAVEMFTLCQSLQKINLANTANCSIWTRAFLNCHSLEDLSSANLAMPGSGFSFTNTFQNCFSIKKIPSYLRIGQTFDFQNNQLSKNAIDNFVSGLTLPLSSLTTLTITGNPGLITNATKTANVATLSNTIVMADTTRMEVGSTVDQAIAANELTNFRSGSSYAQSPLIFNINPSTDTVTIKYTSNALIAPNTAIVFGPAPTITTGSLTNARASVVGMVAGLPPVSTPSGRLRINDIKYANGMWIAVGNDPKGSGYSNTQTYANSYFYSNNAFEWVEGKLPSAQNWSGVIRTNTKWVAYAGWHEGSTAAAISSDGINWEPKTMANSGYWRAAAYDSANSTVMIIARNITGAASTRAQVSFDDGVTWRATGLINSSSPSMFYTDITFGDGKFWIIDYSQYPGLYWSDNKGNTWTKITYTYNFNHTPPGPGGSNRIKYIPETNSLLLYFSSGGYGYIQEATNFSGVSSGSLTFTAKKQTAAFSYGGQSQLLFLNKTIAPSSNATYVSNATYISTADASGTFRIEALEAGNTITNQAADSVAIRTLPTQGTFNNTNHDRNFVLDVDKNENIIVGIPSYDSGTTERYPYSSDPTGVTVGANIAYIITVDRITDNTVFDKVFYVTNVSGNTFQLSTTKGGSIYNIPGTESMNVGATMDLFVTGITTNTSITVNRPPFSYGNTTSYSTNTTMAVSTSISPYQVYTLNNLSIT